MSNNKSDCGYKNPPKNGRFTKGKSGNPKGRPRKKISPSVEFLERELTLDFNGEKMKVPLTEAGLIALFQAMLKGKRGAAKTFLKHCGKFDFQDDNPEPAEPVVRVLIYPEVCDPLLVALGAIRTSTTIVSGREVEQTSFHMELWILEEGLKRSKLRKFSTTDIDRIANSTVDPVAAAGILARAGYIGTQEVARRGSLTGQSINQGVAR